MQLRYNGLNCEIEYKTAETEAAAPVSAVDPRQLRQGAPCVQKVVAGWGAHAFRAFRIACETMDRSDGYRWRAAFHRMPLSRLHVGACRESR